MKTAQVMCRMITRLAEKHEVDLNQVGAELQLAEPGSDRHQLVIKRIEAHQVSVANLVDQNGSLIAEPEIVFFTGYGDPQHPGQALWVPIAIQQVEGGRQTVAELNGDGTHIEYARVKDQAAVADQANDLARLLRDDDWLERSIRLN